MNVLQILPQIGIFKVMDMSAREDQWRRLKMATAAVLTFVGSAWNKCSGREVRVRDHLRGYCASPLSKPASKTDRALCLTCKSNAASISAGDRLFPSPGAALESVPSPPCGWTRTPADPPETSSPSLLENRFAFKKHIDHVAIDGVACKRPAHTVFPSTWYTYGPLGERASERSVRRSTRQKETKYSGGDVSIFIRAGNARGRCDSPGSDSAVRITNAAILEVGEETRRQQVGSGLV